MKGVKLIKFFVIKKYKNNYSTIHIRYSKLIELNCEALHELNECTEVQNPRYKDITLNTYTSA